MLLSHQITINRELAKGQFSNKRIFGGQATMTNLNLDRLIKVSGVFITESDF